MNTARDIVLILVAAALVVALMWPSDKDDAPAISNNTLVEDAENAAAGVSELSADKQLVVKDALHRYFPTRKGLEWRYIVSGPKRLQVGDDWRIRIGRVTSGDVTTVSAQCGFGAQLAPCDFSFVDGEVVVADWPYAYPTEYLSLSPRDPDGVLIPTADKLLEGSSWNRSFAADIKYRTRDKKMKIVDADAVLTQRDQVVVIGTGQVVVPAGVFEGVKLRVISRMEIQKVNGAAKVLNALTTEPFKEEIFWLVDGIGVVKRIVDYAAIEDDVVFSLLRFKQY